MKARLSRRPAKIAPMRLAKCIRCGCDDFNACSGGCYWLVVDRRSGAGVCSECPEALETWRHGRRALPQSGRRALR